MRTALHLAAVLLVALTVAACGAAAPCACQPPTPTHVDPPAPTPDPSPQAPSEPDPAPDANDVARYAAGEADFYARFQYLANAPTDLRIAERDLFVDGVFVCETFADGSGAVDDVVATLRSNRGLTDDGAHAVAAAATEELCTDTGLTVTTRTESEAAQIGQRVTDDLGVDVDEEAAMVDTRIACRFLDTHATAEGLRATLRSEGEPFFDADVVSDQTLNVLVVDGVGIHCPANSAKLGPNFYGV